MSKSNVIIFGLLFLIGLGLGSVFTVEQDHAAVITQMGKAFKLVDEPGLALKAPWQGLQRFDKRIADYQTPVKNFAPIDGRSFNASAYIVYKIVDPLMFMAHANNFEASLNDVFVETVNELGLANEPAIGAGIDVKLADLSRNKSQKLGINVVNFQIIFSGPDEAGKAQIYEEMRRFAKNAVREEQANSQLTVADIKATNELSKGQILAKAAAEAARIKSEGDVAAGEIYAASYGKDPEFFKFYRSMEAYKAALKKENTQFILTPDSEFLKYLK